METMRIMLIIGNEGGTLINIILDNKELITLLVREKDVEKVVELLELVKGKTDGDSNFILELITQQDIEFHQLKTYQKVIHV